MLCFVVLYFCPSTLRGRARVLCPVVGSDPMGFGAEGAKLHA